MKLDLVKAKRMHKLKWVDVETNIASGHHGLHSCKFKTPFVNCKDEDEFR